MNEQLEQILNELRPYLTADEIAHARTLRSSSEIEEYLLKCMKNRQPENKKQSEVRKVKKIQKYNM